MASEAPLLCFWVHSCVFDKPPPANTARPRDQLTAAFVEEQKPAETVEVDPAPADHPGLPARRVLAGKTLCWLTRLALMTTHRRSDRSGGRRNAATCARAGMQRMRADRSADSPGNEWKAKSAAGIRAAFHPGEGGYKRAKVTREINRPTKLRRVKTHSPRERQQMPT